MEDPTSDCWPSGQPISYLGYFDAVQAEAGVRAYDIGDECEIHSTEQFEVYDTDNQIQTVTWNAWRVTIVAPLPGIHPYGDVTLIVKRPFGDEDEINVIPFKATDDELVFHEAQVKCKSSDLSARRMINGVNRLYEGNPLHLAMKRVFRGMDFTPGWTS